MIEYIVEENFVNFQHFLENSAQIDGKGRVVTLECRKSCTSDFLAYDLVDSTNLKIMNISACLGINLRLIFRDSEHISLSNITQSAVGFPDTFDLWEY